MSDTSEERDLREAEGQWFVVQTLSGHEMKVEESIAKRREQEDMEDVVFEALVPMEKVQEVKQCRKTTTNRKFFPGYILVNAQLYDEDNRINDRVWSFINDTPGIIGFIGDRPQPLSQEDVASIQEQMHRGEETAKPKIQYEVGEMVKIRDGAFENFEGKIESIDPDRGRLKLSVTIFGRSTPVEVEYWQVDKEE